MKKLLLVVLATLMLPAIAWGQIRNSPHDLSSSSGATVKSANTDQICRFCHVPHGAQATRLLWVHTASAQVPSWGPTSTTKGTPLPTVAANIEPSSRACLGCHDGSISLGDMSVAIAPAATWTAVGGRVDANGFMLPANPRTIGAGGAMTGNHPISIPYAGQTNYGAGSVSSSAAIGAGNYFATKIAGCTNNTGVCTNDGGLGDGANGNAVQLVRDTSGDFGVECTSCHEPHGRGAVATDFLRVDVVKSGLCRSCHQK